MNLEERYYEKIAAAFVIGKLKYSDTEYLTGIKGSLEEMAPDQLNTIIQAGIEKGLKLHKFKRTNQLPRVGKVLGILKGLYPENLLDIGSGRGTFLWPLLDSFPMLEVTCIDIQSFRVDDINALHAGGILNVKAILMDAQEIKLHDESYDVVTALEVLEHIKNPEKALSEAIRVSKRFAVFSVPSKEDDNPEHIHLFNQAILQDMLNKIGISKVNYEYVHNHLIAIVRK